MADLAFLAHRVDLLLEELDEAVASYLTACLEKNRAWRKSEHAKPVFPGQFKQIKPHRIYSEPNRHVRVAAAGYPALRKALKMRPTRDIAVASYHEGIE